MYDALGSLESSFGDKQNPPHILRLFLQALTPFPSLSLKPWADLELLCTRGRFQTPDHHSSLPWDTQLAPLSPPLNAVISKAGLSPLCVPLPQPSWSFLTASISTRMTHRAPWSITSLASYGQRMAFSSTPVLSAPCMIVYTSPKLVSPSKHYILYPNLPSSMTLGQELPSYFTFIMTPPSTSTLSSYFFSWLRSMASHWSHLASVSLHPTSLNQLRCPPAATLPPGSGPLPDTRNWEIWLYFKIDDPTPQMAHIVTYHTNVFFFLANKMTVPVSRRPIFSFHLTLPLFPVACSTLSPPYLLLGWESRSYQLIRFLPSILRFTNWPASVLLSISSFSNWRNASFLING